VFDNQVPVVDDVHELARPRCQPKLATPVLFDRDLIHLGVEVLPHHLHDHAGVDGGELEHRLV
jgi:hypothetical protein